MPMHSDGGEERSIPSDCWVCPKVRWADHCCWFGHAMFAVHLHACYFIVGSPRICIGTVAFPYPLLASALSCVIHRGFPDTKKHFSTLKPCL